MILTYLPLFNFTYLCLIFNIGEPRNVDSDFLNEIPIVGLQNLRLLHRN